MEAPPLEPIVPLQPIAPPPPTPQETIDVLGNQDLMALVTGQFSQAESRRLQRVSTQVRDAVQGARQQELNALATDPRVQQLALRVRSHLQKPVVRTGVYWDTAPLLAPPTTDVERVVDTIAQGDLLRVPDQTRRDVLLDFRHAAMSSDNPRATSRPLLLDRLGRPIERGREFEGVPDSVQGPVDIRRPDHEQFVQGTAPPPIDERPDRKRDYLVPGR